MFTPQAGIFALGTSSHAYLEFDLLDAARRKEFASTISSIREPRTTTGGVNFVIGFRPELWRALAPDDIPPGVEGFNKAINGVEDFEMPATQHDALVWLSGSAYDVLFDMARSVVHDMDGLATLADETSSWPYRHDRDLTGFIDGSENPTLLDAPADALMPEGTPGAAGSVLLLQKWKHKTTQWEALPVDQQERIMGRTKPDSIELEDKPADSHVARTDYRAGEPGAGTACPQYTVEIAIEGYKKGNQIVRAATGPIGMFASPTQMSFTIIYSDVLTGSKKSEQIKASVRTESESTGVADAVAKKLAKQYTNILKTAATSPVHTTEYRPA